MIAAPFKVPVKTSTRRDSFGAIANCEWQTRMPDGRGWFPYDRSVCKASVAPKIVTVWLPKGAKITFRRARRGYDGARWYHFLGRDRDARIVVYVPSAARVVDA